MFKWYLARVEKEIGKSLKCLRSKKGGELISNEFEIFYNDRGIERQISAPRTPPQNRIVERRNCMPKMWAYYYGSLYPRLLKNEVSNGDS